MTDENKELLSAMKDMYMDLKQEISEVKQKVIKIEATLENQTNKNIQLLVEGYMQNSNKIEKIDSISEDVNNISLDIRLLKNAILHNTEEITRLKMIK